MTKITIFDRIFAATLLKILPSWVTPNHLTVFRFLTIPFLIFFLINNDYLIGIPLFIISALSDALDGAMARTQDKITEWGKMFDPLADKLLIGTVAAIEISKYMNPLYAFIIILLEMFISLMALYRKKNYGATIEAHLVGKIKMIFQSFGLGFILLHASGGGVLVLQLGEISILIAIIFAVLSLFVYKSI
jgi:CDP-diacylglycerol--glycerol-3-phosphate 3-phosphatidyltransferase